MYGKALYRKPCLRIQNQKIRSAKDLYRKSPLQQPKTKVARRHLKWSQMFTYQLELQGCYQHLYTVPWRCALCLSQIYFHAKLLSDNDPWNTQGMVLTSHRRCQAHAKYCTATIKVLMLIVTICQVLWNQTYNTHPIVCSLSQNLIQNKRQKTVSFTFWSTIYSWWQKENCLSSVQVDYSLFGPVCKLYKSLFNKSFTVHKLNSHHPTNTCNKVTLSVPVFIHKRKPVHDL